MPFEINGVRQSPIRRLMESMDYARIADLYDTYVQATFDIPFFLGEAKKSSGEVLELMSGTGRVSLPLVEAGIKLTCVDKFPEMLAILRDKLERRGLCANVVQMDVCELNLSKRFDLVIIPFHSLSEIVSLDDQRKALTRIRKHLSPSGRFICTLHNPKTRTRFVDGTLQLCGKYSLESGQGTLLFWLLQDYDSTDNHIVEGLEFFEEYDAKGILKSKRLMGLRFRLTWKEEFQELAKSVGFKVAALYGDYSYSEFHEESSPFMIWVLGNAESA